MTITPRTPGRHGTVLAVSMMKDEAPYLLEWVAHHLAAGFTKVLVYTNDCTDGTVEMLQRIEALGLGYHRANVIPEGGKPQPSAIRHAQAEPLVAEADWVMVFDADEFLAVSHPSGDLDGVLDEAVARGANGIVVTWRIFGSGGVVDWSRAPVTEQYVRAAPAEWNKGWGVKTLFRFDPEHWKLGIHRPTIKNKWLETDFPESVHWLNGSGQPMEDYFKFRGWRSIRRTVGYDWLQLNHYAVKSVDAYAVRKLRGNVNNKKDKYNADYWALQDRNEVEDLTIQRHKPARDAILADLLADPVLGPLHEAALARLEARLADYKESESYEDLKADLLAAGARPIGEVEAKPPVARDPAKIAELMHRVGRKDGPAPKAGDSTPPAPAWAGEATYAEAPCLPDGGVDWVANHGILLPQQDRVFAPAALSTVSAGRFDRRHARNIESYFRGLSRILDLGCGIGFVSMKASRDLPDLVLMGQDAREGLIGIARQVAAHNGLENSARLKWTSGPLRFAGDGPGAASGLSALLQDFRPDGLRIGPEAGITGEDLAAAPLQTVARILLPFGRKEEIADLRESFGPVLSAEGFVEAEERAGAGSLQFDRAM